MYYDALDKYCTSNYDVVTVYIFTDHTSKYCVVSYGPTTFFFCVHVAGMNRVWYILHTEIILSHLMC